MRKKQRSRHFFMLLFTLCTLVAQGQADQHVYSLQTVIPPSPNASSLGKYADWPVNLYTGVPQINIPIYELKGRSISIPISLSYHASGIKVGEHASSVGLGWSLQAGGVITRSVRGRPDEESSAGYLDVRNYYNKPGDLSSGTIATSGVFCDSMLEIAVGRGDIETEPDLFMFSALGKSYKFYFSKTGAIVTQPYSNIKITVNWNTNVWTVMLEDGTKLLFGGTGCVETTATPSLDVYRYTSAWYLQSVTSAQGEVITFTYTGLGDVTLDSYFYQTDYILDHIDENHLSSGVPTTIKPGYSRAETQDVSMLTLATIESDLGKIYFDSSNTRLDLPGAQKIKSIRVYSKLQGQYLKKFNFYYGYSAAASGNVYPGGYTTPPYRLKLDTLEEVSVDNSIHKYWKFDYNPLALPSRKSFAQDYWGYYNGATANTNFVPLDPNFNPDTYAYANRSADSASMMAEMLTKITYPTGGYSVFSYEPNSYPNMEVQYGSVPVYPHVYFNSTSSPTANTQTTPFTLGKGQFFNFTLKAVYWQLSPDYPNTYVAGSAVLKDASGTALATIGITVGNSGQTVTSSNILLAAGNYTLVVSSNIRPSDLGGAQNVTLDANFTYISSLGSQLVNHRTGGVRIQSIIDYDGIDASKAIKKYYQYENAYVVAPMDSTVDFSLSTTDKLWDCDGTGMTECGLPGCLATSVIYHTRFSSTKYSLGSIQGGTIGYGKVTEKFGANGENGTNVYYYTNEPDMNVASAKGFPYPAIISKDYERGLLLEKDVYSSANVLIAKTLENYLYLGKDTIKTYKLGYKYNVLSECQRFTYLAEFINRTFYQDITDQVQHTSTIQRTYNPATGDSLSDTITYYYEVAPDMQPTKTVRSNSKGEQVISYARRALEKTAINSSIALSATASTAIDSMVARNMVGVPIETEQYVSGIVTNKALMNYKVQSNNYVQLDNVMVKVAQNPVETRLQLNSYDSKGNLLQQQKAGDVKHAYIWDYSSTYPVAEAVNATDSDIAFTSFEADGSGNWSITSTSRDVSAAITGAKSYNLANGSIKKTGLNSGLTYIVSYWSKTGSNFTVTNSASVVQGKTINGWTYFEHTLNSVTGDTISGSGLIDELRLYPKSGQMTTYTYTPLIGITSQADVNSRISYYGYDGMGRLTTVWDQDGNILKKICYNYQNQATTCAEVPTVSTCTGAGNKILNNVCEAGQMVVTSSVTQLDGSWRCTYHYLWSDGSVSPDYTKFSSSSCSMQNY